MFDLFCFQLFKNNCLFVRVTSIFSREERGRNICQGGYTPFWNILETNIARNATFFLKNNPKHCFSILRTRFMFSNFNIHRNKCENFVNFVKIEEKKWLVSLNTNVGLNLNNFFCIYINDEKNRLNNEHKEWRKKFLKIDKSKKKIKTINVEKYKIKII